MIQVSKFEKVLGIILIVFTLSSLGLLLYFGFIFSSDFVLVNKYPDISFELPINPTYANDNSGEVFILEHKGRVRVITDPSSEPHTALDLTKRDTFHWDWEGGLIGLTLDKDYSSNRFVYIFFTEKDNRTFEEDGCDTCVTSVLSRLQYDPVSHNLLENTELRILEVPQFVDWHRSGQMNFRQSDGMFYVNIGDSLRGGTEPWNLYGSILRLDVSQSSESERYRIPTDNPFYNNSMGYREEIYAYGLRNPWRASFDPETDIFWVADVGKDMFEELNIVKPGLNYGWNISEGYVCTHHDPDCKQKDIEWPILAYPHEPTGDLDDPSGLAIIGGYIYHGNNFPELKGKYVFGDYTGTIWALTFNNDYTKITDTKFLTRMSGPMSSIGLDLDGELVFAGHSKGALYELQQIFSAISDYALYMTLYFLAMSLLTYGSFYLQARKSKIELNVLELKRYTVWRFFILNTIVGLGYILYEGFTLFYYSTLVPE